MVNRPRVPWFNDLIKAAIRERRKAERKWRATKDPTHYSVFKQKKNHATLLMNQARCTYYNEFIKKNSADQGRLFKAANSLLSESKKLSLPGGSNAEAAANGIGRFFIDKVTSIHSKLGNAVNSRVSTQDMDNNLAYNSFTSFKSLSVDDVRHIITRSSKKSCSLDPVPTSLVVECMDVLLPVITLIINLSLQSGHFPEIWKEAIVTPLLKKCGSDPSNFKNLRPVSNLSYISKLTESAVADQIQLHLAKNNLYPVFQSAYTCRKLHSMETALVKVQNDSLTNMNKGLVTLLVLLDLSAAFDTVDPSILLTRLRSKLGLSGTALSWFCSYVSGRTQQISVQGALSNVFLLRYGVPQGSCLGPVLLNIYSSKIFDIVGRHLPKVHCYADDSQLYLSFKPSCAVSQDEAIRSMETCISDVKQWMTADKLMLNDDKTEFIVIASRHLLKKTAINTIRVGDCDVGKVSVVRNLGAWFDDQLAMAVHITKICSAAFYHLHNIRRIRKHLSTDSAATLIHSFISSRIDYCNSLLYGVPKCHIDKLQRVQNAAARLVVMQGKSCHITPVLHQLHWLPVLFRINFKVLLLTFKAIRKLAPSYINDLVKIKPSNSRYGLRSNDGILLSYLNFKTLTTLGDRAFVASAPKLWNYLPSDIKMAKSVDTFKKLLKTHLFSKAFYS